MPPRAGQPRFAISCSASSGQKQNSAALNPPRKKRHCNSTFLNPGIAANPTERSRKIPADQFPLFCYPEPTDIVPTGFTNESNFSMAVPNPYTVILTLSLAKGRRGRIHAFSSFSELFLLWKQSRTFLPLLRVDVVILSAAKNLCIWPFRITNRLRLHSTPIGEPL